MSVRGDEHVLRLQIPMDDALDVRSGQATSDGHGVLEGASHCQRTGCADLAQRLAFQQFGHDERRAFVHPDVEDRTDVRVVERRRRASFLLEALEPIRIGRYVGRQNLDRHVALEPRVVGLVDLPHAARVEERGDPIGSDDGTRRQRAVKRGERIAVGASHGVAGQQGIDVSAQRGIQVAGILEIRRTLIDRALQRRVKDRRHDPPAFRRHGSAGCAARRAPRDERGRLQRMVAALAAQIGRGTAPELLIDDRNQAVSGVRLAGGPARNRAVTPSLSAT